MIIGRVRRRRRGRLGPDHPLPPHTQTRTDIHTTKPHRSNLPTSHLPPRRRLVVAPARPPQGALDRRRGRGGGPGPSGGPCRAPGRGGQGRQQVGGGRRGQQQQGGRQRGHQDDEEPPRVRGATSGGGGHAAGSRVDSMDRSRGVACRGVQGAAEAVADRTTHGSKDGRFDASSSSQQGRANSPLAAAGLCVGDEWRCGCPCFPLFSIDRSCMPSSGTRGRPDLSRSAWPASCHQLLFWLHVPSQGERTTARVPRGSARPGPPPLVRRRMCLRGI